MLSHCSKHNNQPQLNRTCQIINHQHLKLNQAPILCHSMISLVLQTIKSIQTTPNQRHKDASQTLIWEISFALMINNPRTPMISKIKSNSKQNSTQLLTPSLPIDCPKSSQVTSSVVNNSKPICQTAACQAKWEASHSGWCPNLPWTTLTTLTIATLSSNKYQASWWCLLKYSNLVRWHQ